MRNIHPADPLGVGVSGDASPFAAAGMSILAAIDVASAAAALRHGLRACGIEAFGIVWRDHGRLQFAPAELDTPAHRAAASAALAGAAPAGNDDMADACLLPGGEDAPTVALLAAPGTLAAPSQAATQLLALAGRRLSELLAIERLHASVKELEQAEQLQHALFAIADIAASDRDMQSLLRGLHDIIGKLMYAENFYIALYHRSDDTLQFIYIADSEDNTGPGPEERIPIAQLEHGLTWHLLRQGRPLRGSQEQIRAQVSGPLRQIGMDSLDWLGVPMTRDGATVGALVVQSYSDDVGFTARDQAVLAFVAEHVLNALERKRGREQLELQVARRTRELADAHARLQAQMAEQVRAEHLQATLYRIAALSVSDLSDSAFHRSIHDAVGELLAAENFYIALLDETGQRLEFAYAVDATDAVFDPRPLGRGLTERVLALAQPVLVRDDEVRAMFARGELEEEDVGPPAQSWLGAPLPGPNGPMGVVVLQSYEPHHAYDANDADLLAFVSSQIASSVQRRRQDEALRRLNAELEERVQARTAELRHEITVREQVEAQLKHQVLHDPLTGLPNRLYLHERLDRALATLKRDPQRAFALLYLDVDRFKLFNDSLGHLAGDAVLREVARRLLECVRGSDVVARLSGDEFAILLEHGEQPDAAVRIGQRIQARMRAAMQVGERELGTSVSVGIAVGHPRYKDIDALLHDADVALYRAKAGGRQRVELFTDGPQPGAIKQLELELDLRQALLRGQLVPWFQPVVRLHNRERVGYEALLRWQHPQRGVLLPGDFLGVAEESGLIEAIDWHMYRLACTSGAPLVAAGGTLSLNISPRHFRHEDFDRRLLALLDETGFPPPQLRIEVTETTLLGDPEATARILQRLHEAGVGTALDDFGTGYSSLSYVHSFPLRSLKIDRSFIRGLDRPEAAHRSNAIVQAVLGMAHSLGLGVVAEGVETEAQRALLLQVGCGFGQGFLFGRPQPAGYWLEAGATGP